MSTFTTPDGCTLDYHIAGSLSSERTLVLLHGWSQSRAMYYDQRGHGESGRPSHGARIAPLARDLDELLTHLHTSETREAHGTCPDSPCCNPRGEGLDSRRLSLRGRRVITECRE
ncbi:hypothetical protein MEBOL_003995 [Melittangium boletus DSM 14713]|uniref:Alpha/beta hydrolase n=1 Tax=Melittangium boletus DSM 14713 TaxID=1294270 RepID=A0A250IFB7_9BACT|nr:hypothetical protein MEBOL_003995 [Melittangium boletus DSM 14713]